MGSFITSLGLTHEEFILIAIILFVIGSLIYLLYRLGLLQHIKFHQWILEAHQVIYVSYEGPYDTLMPTLSVIMDHFQQIFLMSDCFTIYYDDPQGADQNHSRVIFGCLINPIQHAQIKKFISKYPQYKCTEIPKSKCIRTVYPFFNALSFMMIINRVYPALANYVRHHKIKAEVGVVQIYHFIKDHRQISIVVPIQNAESFKLWYKVKNEQKFSKQQ